MRLIWLSACAVVTLLAITALAAQSRPATNEEQIRDIRNRDIPHTDSYFTMRRHETLSAWESRKEHLRRQILTSAGLWPMPERTPLNPQVFGHIERSEGFSIEKVLLETMPGYYLGGNLYRPLDRRKKRPAVLHTHGHYQYGRIEHQHRLHRTVQSEAGQAREHRYPDQVAWAAPMSSPPTMAMNLATQGYVVFVWDMVGYNDTIQTPHTFGTDHQKLWSFGPLGLQLWNATRALDFVQSLEDVDPTRIGMTGSSGGGSQTFLLSAVDERVTAAAPVVMVGGIMQGGSACENAPGLRFGTYNTELAALTAPRPLMLVGSPTDQSANTLTEDAPAIRSVYELYGHADRLGAILIDAPHNYNRFSREAVYRFFAKHLHPEGADRPLKDKPLRIGPPNTLLALHNRTLPENALTFEGLFEQWRGMSEQQSAALTENDGLRERLAATLAVEWPDEVSAKTEGGRLALSREDVGDHVPGRWFEGTEDAALVVHENGSAAAEKTETVKALQAEGKSVLLIDAFQTGAAVEPRNFTFQENRREQGYFLTFNRSDDANRVQDILTALVHLKSRNSGRIQLIGLGKAAVWSTFAAALAPIDVALCADTLNFQGRDEDFLDQLFVPGIQRAGGWKAALQLTEQARSKGCGDMAASADRFVPIFDGSSLDDWEVVPAERKEDWSVRDGRLIGRARGEGSDIIWTGAEVSDFELKLSYRISSPANSGIHIRGLLGHSESHRVSGYHADFDHVGVGPEVLGAWDFHGYPRGSNLVSRGQIVTISESGDKAYTDLENALTPADISIDGWNQVHVIVKGERLWFSINGKTASTVIDREAAKRIDRGVIGLQMHSGQPMWVEFKDILLKSNDRR